MGTYRHSTDRALLVAVVGVVLYTICDELVPLSTFIVNYYSITKQEVMAANYDLLWGPRDLIEFLYW